MFGAIRRVISESDEIGREKNDYGGSETVKPAAPADIGAGQNFAQSPGPSAASGVNVIEPEEKQSEHMDIDDAPITHINSGQRDTGSANSSLSDASSAAGKGLLPGAETDVTMGEEDDAKVAPQVLAQPLKRAGRVLEREDSGADSSSGSQRPGSQNSSRDWGWFTEDVHQSTDSLHHLTEKRAVTKSKPKCGLVPQSSRGEFLLVKDNDVSMAVTAPTYVLEESLSSQLLWKDTAGQRPPQPVEERAFFEKMWAQNFARSQVNYHMPVEVLTATSPISLSPFADGNFEGPTGNTELSDYNVTQQDSKKSDVAEAALVSRMSKSGEGPNSQYTVVNKKVRGPGSDGDLTVLVRGDNVFGTTVSKSFARPSENGGPIVSVDTVNISVASYRVVESKKHGKYAQFLVIYREGGIRDTVGVWKRYSDFEELARIVTQANEGCAAVIANMTPLAAGEKPETEHLPNAITSWRLLKKRQRWFRCLDAGYLSLKIFLLERFLHDILFESSSPKLLRDFVLAGHG